MRGILLLAITSFLSLAALSQPVVGIFAFIGYSLGAPHSFVWGGARTFPHAQLIAISTIIGCFLHPRSIKIPHQREVLLLALLLGVFGFSTMFSLCNECAVTRFIYVVKIFLMVFLSISLVTNEILLHILMRVIALALGFYGFKGGLFALRTLGGSMVYGPDESFLTANNSIGLALTINVPLLFYLIQIETSVWLRRIMRIMLVLSYPAIICTFSRGAWLGLIAITALLVLKSKKKFLVWPIIAVLVIAAPVWTPHLLSQRMVSRYDRLANYDTDSSAESRFWSWEFCSRVGIARPLYGGGFDYYSIKAYETYFPEFLERWPGKIWSCHSMWFTVLGEHGIIGFIVWNGLLGSCFISLRKIRLQGKANEKMTWVVPYTDMLQLALAGFVICGTFLDVAYFDLYYQLVGVIIILKEVIRKKIEVLS